MDEASAVKLLEEYTEAIVTGLYLFSEPVAHQIGYFPDISLTVA